MSLSNITEKRIRHELKMLKKSKIENFQVVQDETNKFIFYFLLKGLDKSDYQGGYYIGKIVLPSDFPKSPVDYYMLTPNGRFLTDKKICLTNSSYHKDLWSPTWSLESITAGFISVFNSDTDTGISHIKDTPENRKKYASESVAYNLSYHQEIFKNFDRFVHPDGNIKSEEEQKQFIENDHDTKPTKSQINESLTANQNDINDLLGSTKPSNDFNALLGGESNDFNSLLGESKEPEKVIDVEQSDKTKVVKKKKKLPK